ncbi:hypothetical protein RB653_007179 [Dictyostelium firmibasis]|uniref:Zinc finger ZPR1-type domain-containing protein n=1 Tax=Dictyostelium firmibasis TaxID=79012 RepID=A0AAN7TU63_9MYCE
MSEEINKSLENTKIQEQEKNEEFKNISHENEVTEIESYCVNCEAENGITRILLTKVPFFKEIMVFAFHCPECGFRNSEVRSGGSYELKGCHIELNVTKEIDLNRQVVKMEKATISIPSLDFEIPPSNNGSLNTIEGILKEAITNLTNASEIHTESKDELLGFVSKLSNLLMVDEPFKFIIDDPSGNSFIENPNAPKADPNLKVTNYTRTSAQNASLGLSEQQQPSSSSSSQQQQEKATSSSVTIPSGDLADREVYSLPNQCSYCGVMGECKMVLTDIPYFKSVLLMAFSCDECGYKTNEIKPGGAISEKGKHITLRVESIEDLSRDILKSDTANVILPELEIEVTHGSLGGKFTTVEGLITIIKEELEKNPFFRGDSSDPVARARYQEITTRLDAYIAGKEPFTIQIDDPVSNSYVQNLFAPDDDPQLTIYEYERTFEQNDELGLNAMNTENYLNEDDKEKENQGEDEKSVENENVKSEN